MSKQGIVELTPRHRQKDAQQRARTEDDWKAQDDSILTCPVSIGGVIPPYSNNCYHNGLQEL